MHTLNMLIGMETPGGSVHLAYLSSAHPWGAITTYHVFSMCAYKIDMTICFPSYTHHPSTTSSSIAYFILVLTTITFSTKP